MCFKTSNGKSSFAKLIVRTIIAIVFVGLLWLAVLYISQPATSNNTYQIESQINSVELVLSSGYRGRGQHKLFLYTDHGTYKILTGHSNDERAEALTERLRKAGTVTITVWEHWPSTSLIDLNHWFFPVEQVVDVRSDSEVYWDLSDHNAYQKRERIFAIILGGLVTVIGLAVLAILWYHFWKVDLPYIKNKKKDKRKQLKRNPIYGCYLYCIPTSREQSSCFLNPADEHSKPFDS